MSDPTRVEALVLAECVADRGDRSPRDRSRGGGGDGGRRARPAGTYAVSRAVQRATPSNLTAVSSASSSASASAPSASLRASVSLAAVHHWRARMMVKLSRLYADRAWDALPLPRKFFIKHRGFGPSHGRADLPSFRAMFLRCALASAERAAELAPASVECATLRACVLVLVVAETTDPRRATDAHLARACAGCRHAIRVAERADPAAVAAERACLILGREAPRDRPGPVRGSPEISGDVDDANDADPDLDAFFVSGERRARSLRSMGAFAAHALAERRGGWDHETSWARELDLEDEREAETGRAEAKEGRAREGNAEEGKAFFRDGGGGDERGGGDDRGGDAAAWDMWRSPGILESSVDALRRLRRSLDGP